MGSPGAGGDLVEAGEALVEVGAVDIVAGELEEKGLEGQEVEAAVARRLQLGVALLLPPLLPLHRRRSAQEVIEKHRHAHLTVSRRKKTEVGWVCEGGVRAARV